MKTPATVRIVALLFLFGAVAGCSLFGIARRSPMVEVRNMAVPVRGDLSATIVSAATRDRWTASVVAPGVVRCTFTARMWNIVVDVRYSDGMFSIEYVSSEGLFFRPEDRTIHPTYNARVEALSRRIVQSASTAGIAVAAMQSVAVAPAAPQEKPYSIELFSREASDKYAYRFILKLNDSSGADLNLSRRIQADLRQSVQDDYLASAGTKDASALRIEFPEYAIRGGKVEGRAVVMTVELLEFIYDPATAHGRLAVKVNPQQYEVTRQWVRNNIATLARDKNANLIGILSGKPRFTIGREILRDDNVLEVEFNTNTTE